MITALKRLKEIQSDCCVTIILETHRTIPENEKDPILLKNMMKEAETRLAAGYDKRVADNMIKRLRALAADIDHRHNQETLILFVNEHIAEYLRLPIHTANRVVIDKTFGTRDIVRALHSEIGYYILVLSRNEARLIEAFNDRVSEEITEGFPIQNTALNPSQRAEAAIASRQTKLVREFFNRVDKALIAVHKKNPLSVLICSDEPNYAEYMQVADSKQIIAGHFAGGNRLREKAHHIVEGAWPVMKTINTNKNNQRLQELGQAVNTGRFATDFNEIWNAVNSGRGSTLFVKQGFFQPAKIENGLLELVPNARANEANVDDVIDEMIERNLKSGGDTVFINGDELEKFNGLVLTTRY